MALSAQYFRRGFSAIASAQIAGLANLLKNLSKISGSKMSSAAPKMSCSGSRKRWASRGWSPKDRIQSTKVAAEAVPGSNSRSPNLRSSHLSVCQLAGEIQRQVGPRDYPGRHETLPLGQTRIAPAGVSRVASDKEAKDLVREEDKIPLAARFNTCFSLLPDGKILQPSVSERLWKREWMAERFPCRQRRSPIFGSTKVVSPLLTSERNAQLVI